jgi:quercetin dioxygenase-like cupin family protein
MNSVSALAAQPPEDAEPMPAPVFHASDTVNAMEFRIPAGKMAMQHRHEFSHLAILATGEVEVVTDEGKLRLRAPACINLPAYRNHAVLALTDTTWFCCWDSTHGIEDVRVG